MKPLESLETLSVRVTGRVQGVGFRAATVRHAHLLGVRGWVQNNADGSVQALLQGSADQVDRMLSWMQRGPPAAAVKDVVHETRDEPRKFERFQQL